MDVVKPLIFLLTADEALGASVAETFSKQLGPVFLRSPWHLFDCTDYYTKEMGPGLRRSLFTFQNGFEPEKIAELKKMAKELEKVHSADNKRKINIDPGYLDLFKLVLATHKPGGERIAVAKGIYAASLLRYEKGIWQAFTWTFPDIKTGLYDKELTRLRKQLLLDFKRSKHGGIPSKL